MPFEVDEIALIAALVLFPARAFVFGFGYYAVHLLDKFAGLWAVAEAFGPPGYDDIHLRSWFFEVGHVWRLLG